MNSPYRRPRVALLNTSEDLLALLRGVLEHKGFECVVGRIFELRAITGGFERFLADADPQVVVADIPPDFLRNWQWISKVRLSTSAARRSFVVTTTNRAALERMTGPTSVLESVGTPQDLSDVFHAVCAGYAEYRRATGDVDFAEPDLCAIPEA